MDLNFIDSGNPLSHKLSNVLKVRGGCELCGWKAEEVYFPNLEGDKEVAINSLVNRHNSRGCKSILSLEFAELPFSR